MDNTLNILDHAGDAVFAVNEQKRVVYWNTAAEKMLGIKSEDAYDQPCWKLLKGQTVEGKPFCGLNCPILAKLDTREPIPHFDLWVSDKSGQPVLTNISTFTIPKRNGRRQPDQAAIIHLMRTTKHDELPQYDLRINLLGPLAAWRADGTQIDGKFWRRGKVRGLFVYLALKRGKPASKDELIPAFWPELERPAALRSLNTTVYNLRRSLEPDLEQNNPSRYIFHEDGSYWLSGSFPHWLDVDAFEQGIQQARMETTVSHAVHLYQETLTLYRGDYLLDLGPHAGIDSDAEQNRLRQLYVSALEELGNLYQQQEQMEPARNVYLKVLALDPYRENALHQLARISYGANSLMDSVAYCQRLAAALKDELDLVLSQDIIKRHGRNKSSHS